MNEITLSKKINRIAVTRLLLSLPVLILGSLLLCLMSLSGLLSPIGFPEPAVVSTTVEIDRIANLPMGLGVIPVSVQASVDDIADTGFAHTDDGVETGYYMAAWMGDKYVLCLVSPSDYEMIGREGSYRFAGVVKYADADMISKLADLLVDQGASRSEAEALFEENYIDATEPGVAPRAMLYGFTAALLLAGLWLACRNILVLMNHTWYGPVRKAIQDDRDAIFAAIEQEYQACAAANTYPLIRGRKQKPRSAITILKEWIVCQGPNFLRLMKAEDLLWAYQQKKTTKYYGIITTGVIYTICLRSRKASITITGEEITVNHLLAVMRDRFPFAVVGYSPRLETLWRAGQGKFEEYARRQTQGGDADGGGGIPVLGERAKDFFRL